MKPLKVALLIRDHPFYKARETRWCGFFSYPVDEFDWQHVIVTPGAKMDRSTLTDFDVIVTEDETECSFTHQGPPVVFLTWDGSLSPERYQTRRGQAAMSDLVLVEHDHLERYRCVGKPVRRLLFAVNDWLFKDYGLEKTVEVSFNSKLKNRPDRVALDLFLQELCETAGWRYGQGFIDRQVGYAQALNQSKIVVNLSKSPYNRNFRFFDTMASRACLLSSPLPYVEGDSAEVGTHWREWASSAQLAGQLASLLQHGAWERVAEAGYTLMRSYRWSLRAAELRVILNQELGL